jgi:hypothetical protein
MPSTWRAHKITTVCQCHPTNNASTGLEGTHMPNLHLHRPLRGFPQRTALERNERGNRISPRVCAADSQASRILRKMAAPLSGSIASARCSADSASANDDGSSYLPRTQSKSSHPPSAAASRSFQLAFYPDKQRTSGVGSALRCTKPTSRLSPAARQAPIRKS